MSQAPFTDCGNLDPAPFITACKSTACKYAADERPVDFPACQYMEAYAKACKLNTGVTLGAWRSTAGCCKIVVCFNYLMKWDVNCSRKRHKAEIQRLKSKQFVD